MGLVQRRASCSRLCSTRPWAQARAVSMMSVVLVAVAVLVMVIVVVS